MADQIHWPLADHERTPVSREEVLRHWLGKEVAEAENDDLNVDAIDDEERLLEELAGRKPIAGSMFAARDLDWYRLELTEDELRDLALVKGPEDEDWRSVVDDDLVESVARKVYRRDETIDVDDQTQKDLAKVRTFADNLPDADQMGTLVLVHERDAARPYVADGNHRAAGKILHLLRGGEYVPQDAYLGLPADEE